MTIPLLLTTESLPTTGLVQFLHQVGLPRAQREVSDFLDARAQQDVALRELSSAWVGEFSSFLQQVYGSQHPLTLQLSTLLEIFSREMAEKIG